MKRIILISKIVFILFFLLMVGIFIITLSIDYKNIRVCRNNYEFNINNYKEIKNVEDIKIIRLCDNVNLLVYLDDLINETNVNSFILSFIYVKEKYNDDEVMELYFINNNIKGRVFIFENESFEIDLI